MFFRNPRALARLLFAGLALAAFSLTLLRPAGAAAQSGERCFPETGFCISGPIRQYWERNGGLQVFGYPITAQRIETVEFSWTGPVQWFERDRLEDHSNDGLGVLAGRLGARALEVQGINWQTPAPDNAVFPGCRFFRETGYNLCGPFLRHWERNGGLERFGYPITRERPEQIQGREYTVQYFERRRMELHPENAGTPYDVLLGLLGRDVYAYEGDRYVVPVAPGDLAADTQQAILDAAYAAARAQASQGKLAIGIVEVEGDRATLLAKPFGQIGFTVALVRRDNRWQAVQPTETPGGDASSIIDLALSQLQNPQGSGLNAYITRPRLDGDYARIEVAPGSAENLDPVSMFFKREQNTWRFLTAGTAFREEDLQSLGIPASLHSHGAAVRGPQ